MTASATSFTIAFGKVARTIEYREGTDCIIFAFDVTEEERSLVLEHHAMHAPRPPNYDQAFACTKQFLKLRGYKVEAAGGAHLPAPLTEEEAGGFIRGQIHRSLPPSIQLVAPPVRASFRDDHGSQWNLWLTAELKSGPHRGHKLVFDDQTKQFGVASDANVFLGFWGSFSQTIEALVAP
jgi:hypothetical protein